MIRRAILATLLLVLATAASFGQESGERDSWRALFLDGKKAGYIHEKRTSTSEDGRRVWITETEMSIVLSRMGAPLEIDTRSVVIEDEDGRVLSFEQKQDMGALGAMHVKGIVTAGTIEIDQAGMKRSETYPEGALGPVATERAFLAAKLSPGEKHTAVVFSTEAPARRVESTLTMGEMEKKDLLGRVLLLRKATMVSSLLPVPTSVWMDETFEILVTEMDMPGLGKMVSLLTEKDVALAKNEPSEVFTTSFVSPDRAIPTPRKLMRAVYRLGKAEGALEGIYEGEGQKIMSREDGKLTLEAAVPASGEPTYTLPVAGEAAGSYLAASPYIETGDETVRKLAEEALGGEKDARAAAAKIEAFVRERITEKSLNVGFATAAEVAKTLEGDCTEHAVLCAAIARVAGLPARIVTGLVYLPPLPDGDGPLGKHGIFGYHMWTEVLVAKDTWLPIDAAIGTWDATHIALSKSDLASDTSRLDMTLAMLDVIGTLKIEVIEPAK